jgi:hypothetical protein
MATSVELLANLRAMLSDDDPTKNILNGQKEMYSDTKLSIFLDMACRDINSGSPRTIYALEEITDENLIIMGATIFACLAEGILQLRNNIDYNDAGLALAMFNKTGGYQSWYGLLLQNYLQSKMDFKRGVIPSSAGAGFRGIGSQFHQDWGCNY